MSILNIIRILAIVLCIGVLIWFLYKHQEEKLNFIEKAKIAFIGLIANFFDTLGIGSFAIIVALRSMLNVMPDDVRLIGTMNIQAMVTALFQTLIFLHFFQIDITTLVVCIIMISLGGYVSGLIATHIKARTVHFVMLIAFIITGGLLFLSQMNLFPIHDTGNAITGIRLALFAIFMFISGMLPAFGVGYYSLVRTSMFLFGVNPVIGFPIMSCASSFQMPVTSTVFINKKKFYFKSTILLAVFGSVGVFIAAPIINMLDSHTLKWWLLIVVIYNIIALSRSYKTAK